MAVMRVVVALPGILAAHLELGRADARTLHALGPDRLAIDRQASESGADLLERHARVDQRADDHVAGRTREAVEVQDLHNLSILLDAPREASRLDERVVPLLGENQMIDDVDAHDVAGANHSSREPQVVAARRRVAGRVVVEQHDG